MKELLQKLESIPWADNKAREVFKLLEKYPDLKEKYIPKFEYLVNVADEWSKDKQSIDKWDWMYDKICDGALVYYCLTPWLGSFEIFKDNELIGEFHIKLPLLADGWDFNKNYMYWLTGTEWWKETGETKMRRLPVLASNLLRWEWEVCGVKYRLKQ